MKWERGDAGKTGTVFERGAFCRPILRTPQSRFACQLPFQGSLFRCSASKASPERGGGPLAVVGFCRLTPRPSAQAEIFYRGGTDVERELLSTGSCVIL